MKKVYRTKARMYRATHAVLKKDELLWVDLPGFVKAEQKLAGFIHQLKEDESGQKKDSRGVTLDKVQARQLLVSKMIEGAATVMGHADSEEMKQRLRLRTRLLMKMPDTTFEAKAREILGLIQQHSAVIESDGITPAWLEEVGALVGCFAELISQVRLETAYKGSATLSIEEVIAQTDELLKFQLDGRMERFRKNQPDFFARYKNARKIVDQGAVTKSLEDSSDSVA